MKGMIILTNHEDVYDYSLCENLDKYGYEISISTDLNVPFIKLVTEPTDLDEGIKSEIEYLEDEEEQNTERIEFYKNCRESALELLKNAEYVLFDFSDDEVLDYLKSNPILKTKKLILNHGIGLTEKELNQFEELFGDYMDNLYFRLDENLDLINFNEYKATIKKIDDIANEINRFNFSPLEKIMYVYDIVRNKVYKEMDEGEDKSKSRSLSSALLGDRIVCLGYAAVFEALLKRVGIDSKKYLIYGEKNGHARTEIYIKDKKYGVDGVYYFDPTFDSKKKEDDNTYLYSYRHFAMTKSKMDQIDREYKHNKFYYFSPHIVKEFLDIYEKKGFSKIPKKYFDSLNYMSNAVNGKWLIEGLKMIPIAPCYGDIDIEQFKNDAKKIVKKFNTPLTAEILIKVLYNVRKIQYYNDSDKYPFTYDDFTTIFLVSNWDFKKYSLKNMSPEERVLFLTTGKPTRNIKFNEFIDYSRRIKLYKDIKGVQLTKVLQKACNKK